MEDLVVELNSFTGSAVSPQLVVDFLVLLLLKDQEPRVNKVWWGVRVCGVCGCVWVCVGVWGCLCGVRSGYMAHLRSFCPVDARQTHQLPDEGT